MPPALGQSAGCEIAAPQFAGRTTFLLVAAYPAAAYLLASTNGGRSWQVARLPAGAGPYPRLRFFSAADAIAVSAGPLGLIGRDFYLTSDGGQTWTAFRQGMNFRRQAERFDFVSTLVGFAWLAGSDQTGGATPIYTTSDSGRTWTPVTPRLG